MFGSRSIILYSTVGPVNQIEEFYYVFGSYRDVKVICKAFRLLRMIRKSNVALGIKTMLNDIDTVQGDALICVLLL